MLEDIYGVQTLQYVIQIQWNFSNGWNQGQNGKEWEGMITSWLQVGLHGISEELWFQVGVTASWTNLRLKTSQHLSLNPVHGTLMILLSHIQLTSILQPRMRYSHGRRKLEKSVESICFHSPVLPGRTWVHQFAKRSLSNADCRRDVSCLIVGMMVMSVSLQQV